MMFDPAAFSKTVYQLFWARTMKIKYGVIVNPDDAPDPPLVQYYNEDDDDD